MDRSPSLLALLLLVACPGDDGPTPAGSGDSTTTGDPSPTTGDLPPTTTGPGTGDETGSTSAADDSTAGTAGPTGTTDDGSTTGSTDTTSDSSESSGGGVDMDMDGFPDGLDCDDDDPLVHPGAPERCNGRDDDCDPMTTEDGVVSVDGQGSHATVGDGIAASVPGSEVRICPGTYVETLSIAHDLQLVSEGGPTVTTIDGNDGGPTVSVGAGTVSITGLTITGGSSVGLGGGLSITGTDPVTVTDCLIVGNQSSDGAGIYTYSGAQLSLQQTTVAENLGEIGGGLMFQGSSLSVSQCTFTDNISGEVGGGMVIFGLPAVQLSDTAITDNQSLDGGGLAVEAASLDLQDCTIERNSASSSGGGLLMFSGHPGTVGSTHSSWGTGPDDNSPQDVTVAGVGSFGGYGAGASFSCSAAGCL
ncbi:MAG: right-handed parallel beta-helix repeat-containing protein [Myxococcales bacterium]|nr:right-handed parallel beta-helix repeat-containing protein [Myxococcales bacterium]MCB9713555.1 right-handed parallel beta-helix repeat-containing protein [Myxococcales bacterium]